MFKVFSNETLIVNQTIQLKQFTDISESLSIHYKDIHEITNLTLNTKYLLHVKVLNGYNEWSEWSKFKIFKTLNNATELYTNYKQSLLHQSHHQRNQQDQRKYKHHNNFHDISKSKHERYHSSIFTNSSNILADLNIFQFNFLILLVIFLI